MENKERNLISLNAEFHEKGKALRGLTNTMQFINCNKNEELKYLLRFHSPIGVYGKELIERFEIDALLEYYNILLVAIFAGYIPPKFDENTSKEMKTILRHPSFKPYYEMHYKYKMVSYALQFVEEDRQFEQKGNATTISAFNEFLSLNRFLKRDKDIEHYLGMLDDVWYDNDTISDVNKILASEKKLTETFTTKNKTKAQSGVWGFIKYTTFLSQFKDLLLETEQYPMLQSSFWMFHGYYFDRMNVKMEEVFTNAFNNLEKSLADPKIFKNIIEEIYGNNVPEEIRKIDLQVFAKDAIQKSRADVLFVLNTKLGESLKNYFSNNSYREIGN